MDPKITPPSDPSIGKTEGTPAPGKAENGAPSLDSATLPKSPEAAAEDQSFAGGTPPLTPEAAPAIPKGEVPSTMRADEQLVQAIEEYRPTFSAQSGFVVAPHCGFPKKGNESPEVSSKYEQVREVKSWVDVAPLLADLYSKDDNSIRVVFPEVAEADKPEQKVVRDFLRKHHGEPLESFEEILAVKLNSSGAFRSLTGKYNGVTAEAWVKSHFSAVAEASKRQYLDVADIVVIKDAKELVNKVATDGGLLASALQAKPDGPKVIIETPAGTQDSLEQLARVFASLNPRSNGRDAYICLMPTDEFGKRYNALPTQAPGRMQVYRLADFISTYTTLGASGTSKRADNADVVDGELNEELARMRNARGKRADGKKAEEEEEERRFKRLSKAVDREAKLRTPPDVSDDMAGFVLKTSVKAIPTVNSSTFMGRIENGVTSLGRRMKTAFFGQASN